VGIDRIGKINAFKHRIIMREQLSFAIAGNYGNTLPVDLLHMRDVAIEQAALTVVVCEADAIMLVQFDLLFLKNRNRIVREIAGQAIRLELFDLTEPPRDCRRLFGLSYAAMGSSSSMA
jgi:hypothetical protein